MNSRIQRLSIIVTVALLIGIVFALFTKEQTSVSTLPATVVRDCAPWDGAAFRLTVEIDSAIKVYISIWRAPDILVPTTIELSASETQIGSAYTLPELGPYTPLNGEVWFQRVKEGEPIYGRFGLTSERGETYEGSFIAEWVEQIVYCG